MSVSIYTVVQHRLVSVPAVRAPTLARQSRGLSDPTDLLNQRMPAGVYPPTKHHALLDTDPYGGSGRVRTGD